MVALILYIGGFEEQALETEQNQALQAGIAFPDAPGLSCLGKKQPFYSILRIDTLRSPMLQ